MLASDPVDLQQVERELRQGLDAIGPAPRATIVAQLMRRNAVLSILMARLPI